MANLRTRDGVLDYFSNVGELSDDEAQTLDTLSEQFRETAMTIFDICPNGPEKTLALRALKDARARAVEAVLFPGS